jgi:hypothetical protein
MILELFSQSLLLATICEYFFIAMLITIYLLAIKIHDVTNAMMSLKYIEVQKNNAFDIA